MWETNGIQCERVNFLFQGKGLPTIYMDTVQYSTRKCMDGLSSTVILRITTLYSKKYTNHLSPISPHSRILIS